MQTSDLIKKVKNRSSFVYWITKKSTLTLIYFGICFWGRLQNTRRRNDWCLRAKEKSKQNGQTNNNPNNKNITNKQKRYERLYKSDTVFRTNSFPHSETLPSVQSRPVLLQLLCFPSVQALRRGGKTTNTGTSIYGALETVKNSCTSMHPSVSCTYAPRIRFIIQPCS